MSEGFPADLPQGVMPRGWFTPTLCAECVRHREQYRYTGRGRRGGSGFEMHYTEKQCTRKPVIRGLCRQHARFYGIE